eukprot:CCRYP_014575-RA/>CCRYP_014575-RA protein AED:0.47 eAED:0.51 QI:0/0/0/1/1/1/3/0/64
MGKKISPWATQSTELIFGEEMTSTDVMENPRLKSRYDTDSAEANAVLSVLPPTKHSNGPMPWNE